MDFNKNTLVSRLAKISAPARAAFAAGCAERLFPSYVTYVEKTGHGDAHGLRAELDQVWSLIDERDARSAQSNERLQLISRYFVGENTPWTPFHPAADDAAAAVYHAAKAAMSGDPNDAATAAEHVYNALDNYVIEKRGLDVSESQNEKEVLNDARIQQELNRQERDIHELRSAVDLSLMIGHLKVRAQNEPAIQTAERGR